METGTLKELNVKPGDVVECIDDAGRYWWKKGKKHIVEHDCRVEDNTGDKWEEAPFVKFAIVSRAEQVTPTPDLTAISTPFGLLDDATKKAMRDHGGPYQHFDGKKWSDDIEDQPCNSRAYRVKPKPEMAGFTIEYNGHKASAFIQLKDGKPDWSTLQVRND